MTLGKIFILSELECKVKCIMNHIRPVIIIVTITLLFDLLMTSYLSELVNASGRCLRSTNNYNLSQPRLQLKSRGDHAFAVVGPRLWNSLHVSLRSLSSLYKFKLKLKLYLLELAFIKCIYVFFCSLNDISFFP